VFAGSLAGSVELAGCKVLPESGTRLNPRSTIADVCPKTVVICGPAAKSCWEQKGSRAASLEVSREWAAASNAAGCKTVLMSSDAVFTGPWMFHDEDGTSHCASAEADAIRQLENDVLGGSERALVVRTNAIGWAAGGQQGWLETTLALIEARRPVILDAVRHATPILATDLAEMLEGMLAEDLSGMYHVAGAERVSPLGFAQRLAGQFNLPWIPSVKSSVQTAAPVGFGAGECSLQTRKVRRELCVPMPLLSETLERLEGQQINGHREKLTPNATVQLRAA
jgi:dTDP-4-dehydrorhamnose reductase